MKAMLGDCYDLGAYIYLGYNRQKDSAISVPTTVEKFNTTIDVYYSNGSLVEFNGLSKKRVRDGVKISRPH